MVLCHRADSLSLLSHEDCARCNPTVADWARWETTTVGELEFQRARIDLDRCLQVAVPSITCRLRRIPTAPFMLSRTIGADRACCSGGVIQPAIALPISRIEAASSATRPSARIASRRSASSSFRSALKPGRHAPGRSLGSFCSGSLIVARPRGGVHRRPGKRRASSRLLQGGARPPSSRRGHLLLAKLPLSRSTGQSSAAAWLAAVPPLAVSRACDGSVV